MALNDAQLASMRQLLKHYERTITALVKDGAQSIRHADNTRLFHEVGKIRDKLVFYKKKFGQTGNAIGNAMRVHPRQQIGARSVAVYSTHRRTAKSQTGLTYKYFAGSSGFVPRRISK